jgi:hypothetical protein
MAPKRLSGSTVHQQKIARQEQMRCRHRREVAAKAALSAGAAAFHHYDKSRRNDSSMTGQAFMDEQLAGHPGVFYDNFGMHKHVFHRLLRVLQAKAELSDTKHVSAVDLSKNKFKDSHVASVL